MTSGGYDIITVGGGLAGATLAKAMAERGARVLVLERETRFKDRVRGEQMHPWGVAEARKLDIYDLLRTTCGHELPWFDMYVGAEQTAHRDLIATTPHQAPEFSFYHPAMQEVLLQAAVEAGAVVRRGALVRDVRPGARPTVTVEMDGRTHEVQGRLVVGADGRTSTTRKWGRFTARRDPERLMIAGLLFDDMPVPEDTSYILFNPSLGQAVPLFPQGNGRVRAYFVYQKTAEPRLKGDAGSRAFVEESIQTGAPAEFYRNARAAGPLASFDAADNWVDHPYKDGVALIGDAAASNDPAYGEGLSLTVRDVRVLSDHLLANADWDAAAHAYAEEHDRHYTVIHTVTRWFGEVFFAVGPEADARRKRAFPLIAQDRTRVPDHIISGPDLPVNEDLRVRFFGEE